MPPDRQSKNNTSPAGRKQGPVSIPIYVMLRSVVRLRPSEEDHHCSEADKPEVLGLSRQSGHGRIVSSANCQKTPERRETLSICGVVAVVVVAERAS